MRNKINNEHVEVVIYLYEIDIPKHVRLTLTPAMVTAAKSKNPEALKHLQQSIGWAVRDLLIGDDTSASN